MIKGSLHTHTSYCDGKSTAEEMINSAIEKGFTYIGFSGHGHTTFDDNYCMSAENERKYVQEISLLKDKYKDKINILCGIERDLFSDYYINTFDYEIASVHYVKGGEKLYDVDNTCEIQNECIKECFGGDPYAYAEAYYNEVSLLKGDIIGHFDLITKFDRCNEIFSPKEERYKKAVLNALEILLDKNYVLEVNTGAMSRGYKDAPYPDTWILQEIKKRGGRIILTSDCHSAPTLDYGYDLAEKILCKIGFRDIYNIDFIKQRQKR